MRSSKILAKLRRNEPVLLPQLHLTDESVFEMTSLLGFDGIWMDLEHHACSLETASRMIRATRVGDCDIVARAAKGEFTRFARLLEAGASGLMYPRCDDAAEALRLVNHSKFAPLGMRGFDGGNPDMPYLSMPVPDYIEAANRQTLIVVQIEDPAALQVADQIAGVNGVDGIFFGPADFSILAGIPGEFRHSMIDNALDEVARAARGAGKFWGAPCFSQDHAKNLLDRGARFLACGADIAFLRKSLESMREQFSKIGFTFHETAGG